MVNEQSPELDILEIFERLSSDKTKSLLVDLSVYSEETGEKIDGVIEDSGMIKRRDELEKAYDELRRFGLVEKGKVLIIKDQTGKVAERKFVPTEDGDRIRLAKGVQTAIRKHITKEI